MDSGSGLCQLRIPLFVTRHYLNALQYFELIINAVTTGGGLRSVGHRRYTSIDVHLLPTDEGLISYLGGAAPNPAWDRVILHCRRGREMTVRFTPTYTAPKYYSADAKGLALAVECYTHHMLPKITLTVHIPPDKYYCRNSECKFCHNKFARLDYSEQCMQRTLWQAEKTKPWHMVKGTSDGVSDGRAFLFIGPLCSVEDAVQIIQAFHPSKIVRSVPERTADNTEYLEFASDRWPYYCDLMVDLAIALFDGNSNPWVQMWVAEHLLPSAAHFKELKKLRVIDRIYTSIRAARARRTIANDIKVVKLEE